MPMPNERVKINTFYDHLTFLERASEAIIDWRKTGIAETIYPLKSTNLF